MDIRRSFSSKQNKLANELNSISQTSNIERTDIIKRVSEEFNKITSQSYSMSLEKEQGSLHRLFDDVDDFQRQLSVMAERILYRKNILVNYVFLHYRRQKWRNAFSALKSYSLHKRYRARCLRIAQKSFRRQALRRIVNAWRNVKYDTIVDG